MSSGADRHDEQVAREIVSKATGARLSVADHRGAPAGTVDARLFYPDGRTGVLEISTLCLQSEFDTYPRIAALDGRLPMPGRWKWIVSVSNPWELERIQEVYVKAILTCEANDAATIGELPTSVIESDQDLAWLHARSTPRLFGIRLPPGAQDTSDFIDLTYEPAEPYRGFPGPDEIVSEVNGALARKPLAGKVKKLLRTDGDERHLFLHVAASGLDEHAYARLVSSAIAPQYVTPVSGDPDLPEPIGHLWLYPGSFNRVSRWTRGQGWDHLEIKADTALALPIDDEV